MPISYSQMVANTASVAVPVGESSLMLVYYPERITDEVFLLINSFMNVQSSSMGETLNSLNIKLAELIKSWDAYEDDAQSVMLPIEEATFRKFSVNFKTDLLGKMIANIRPEVSMPQIPSSSI